jgi:hypothetical protein
MKIEACETIIQLTSSLGATMKFFTSLFVVVLEGGGIGHYQTCIMNVMYTYHVLIFMWYYPNGLNLGRKKT